jgi:hypothetical protein
MKKYAYHPICLLFPQMTDEELQELAEDIRIKGLLHPIVLYQGKILDGRNRYLACPMAGVKPRFVEWQGPGSPLQWVISENMIRRHLTSSQRAVLALELLPLLEQEAKNRTRQSPGRGKKVGKKFPTFSGNGRASEVAASLVHTNSAYVQAVKTIQHQAPELVEKIRSGILKVPDAARLARLPAAERKGILRLCNGHPLSAADLRDLTKRVKKVVRQRAAKAFARSSTSSSNILIGDMTMLSKRLENGSVDLFLTDPPYTQIDLYERLAELAAVKLKPGGLCLAYAGQFHLPAVLEAMSTHLKYWWLFAIQFGGQHCAMHARRIQNKWKPIVAFAKPPSKQAPNWLSDLLEGGGRDKEHHDWGQDESEVAYLIQRLTEPGQFVVDPFCGGGTVPAACKVLGRKWLATEKDRSTALVARKRVAEMAGKLRKSG